MQESLESPPQSQSQESLNLPSLLQHPLPSTPSEPKVLSLLQRLSAKPDVFASARADARLLVKPITNMAELDWVLEKLVIIHATKVDSGTQRKTFNVAILESKLKKADICTIKEDEGYYV